MSPSQMLFHRQIRDKLPSDPQHYQLHKKWIITAKQREALLKSKNEASMKNYNIGSQRGDEGKEKNNK